MTCGIKMSRAIGAIRWPRPGAWHFASISAVEYNILYARM